MGRCSVSVLGSRLCPSRPRVVDTPETSEFVRSRLQLGSLTVVGDTARGPRDAPRTGKDWVPGGDPELSQRATRSTHHTGDVEWRTRYVTVM